MRIREFITQNLGLKLTAIFLAYVLWLIVRGDPGAERIISVPLEIRVPRYMEVTSERPSTVDVTVRGVFTNVWYGPAIPTYVVDLSSYGEGSHTVQLAPENVRFPTASGLEAIAVRPARIAIALERTINLDVPIKILLTGEPDRGIDVYSASCIPEVAIITGPSSHVKAFKEVPTEPIALDGQRQSFRRFANLDIKDDLVHSTPIGPVEVNVELGTHRTLQTIARVPVAPDGEGWTIKPSSVTVIALVPITYVPAMTAADLNATAYVANTDPAEQTVTVAPIISLKGPYDPAVIIKEVRPAEVKAQRATKQ